MDFGDFTVSISLRALRRRPGQGSQGLGERTQSMKRNDSEVISTASGTSKGSERRKSRFSLRRIFYQGRSGRSKSHLSLNSNSSAQSESSFVVGDKEHRENHGETKTLGATAAASGTVASLEDSTGQLNLTLPSTSPPRPSSSDKDRECPLCLMEYPEENFPEVSTCYHRSCLNCLRMYLRIEITESRVNIACPECAEKFHPNDIKDIIQDEVLMTKYEDFMVRRVLVSDPDTRWCPAPDCGFAVIAKECAGCPKIKCERPGCDTFFCYHCKQFWHPNKTCDAARAERLLDARNGSLTYSQESDFQKDFIKPCPRCSAFIMKMNDGSCNHMTCPVCGAEFCWLCMKEISDLHYLSPSGCTFWGKKPWSRKKKILWQLGTLVGAPVGITLLAGIAVPAMVIGIPVWVGRKIHSKYAFSTRPRRNLAIVGGVTVSVLMSPIVAGLAVGIGVPILLGYVYGVVPISLCRSGGCGVRTTNKGGVRFEFEEEIETGIPSPMYSGVDSQSVGTGHQVTNPSIAPSIGEASVGMANSIYSASGSHMDRVGIVRDDCDRDSSSNRAIAGASLNGSMCGSTYAAVVSLQTKLEVQAEMEADIPVGKRASFSSESANFSIGEKSIGEKSVVGDDASTLGLAGSIANYKMDSASITAPSEVHVDVPKPLHGSNHHSESEHCAQNSATGTQKDGEIGSLTSGMSHEEKKKINSCPGSPLSGCGSLCDHDENGKQHNLRCRKCRRLAKLAEKATEQMNVHFSDQVSLQSFQADDMVLDLPMGKHDIDSLSEMCNEEGSESDECIEKCKVKRLTVRNNSEPAILLTEVESDHPAYCKTGEIGATCDRRCSSRHSNKGKISPREASSDRDSLSSFASSVSMKFALGDDNRNNNHEELLLSRCRSEDIYKKRETKGDIVSEKSKSEEIFNKEKTGAVGGAMKRVRRKSCELAIQNGRISPLSVISDD